MDRPLRGITAMRSGKHVSILIVEDVAAMRMFLRTMLEDKEVQISEAGSIKEARHYLRGTQGVLPDFVLLDLELPDGNGLEILPDVPPTTSVIALTAEVNREVEIQCRDAGCDQIIEKNYKLSSLWEFISRSKGMSTRNCTGRIVPTGSYTSYLTEVLDDLGAAKNGSDCLAIRRIAHRLQGTAVHFGYPRIGSAAKSVSGALSAGQLEHFDTATDELLTRIRDALEAQFPKSQQPALP